MQQWCTDPNIVGLAYDAAGIFVFGVPAVLLTTKDVASAGGSFWDYDSGAMRRMLEQKFDTFVGSTLLVAGFAGQLLAAASYSLLDWAAIAAWALLFLVLLGYAFTRRRIVSYHLARAIALAKAESAT